jgi:hypothetical protein
MIRTFRGPIVPFVILLGACTVEKKDDATIADTPAATIVVPPPPPAQPAPQPSSAPTKPSAARDSTKSSKPVVKATTQKPADTLERDSAIQPTFVIGADGKIKPVKKK